MSQLLIHDHLSQLDLIKRVSGSGRETGTADSAPTAKIAEAMEGVAR
jgi:hypothetical protein